MENQPIQETKNSFEKNRELLEKKIKSEPQAVFVVSGDIVPSKIPGREKEFRSPAYTDLDYRDLITGGRARVIASAELAKYFPNAMLVTTSYALGKTDRPSHASVIARELVEMGVPSGRIELEERSYNSLTELEEMVKLIKKNQWKNVVLITSEYHIPRMKIMFGQLRKLSQRRGGDKDGGISDALDYMADTQASVQFVSAEDILPLRSSHYVSLIETVRKTKAYQDRVESEKQGVAQLSEGTYKHV